MTWRLSYAIAARVAARQALLGHDDEALRIRVREADNAVRALNQAEMVMYIAWSNADPGASRAQEEFEEIFRR